MSNKDLSNAVNYLNERYDIWQFTNSPSDKAYYDGAVMILRKCNFTVLRNDEGKHRIF